MKAFLALAVLFSLSHADIEVTELFRAETPAELEAALVDGYPMPWLAEVLADSSIPEEDRYWLDCRMRAVIAQDLHMFFDEEGNPVRIDADWIWPGEDYWRECFSINRDGVDDPFDVSNQPTGNWGGQGYVSDRYGNNLGPLAICPIPKYNSCMSRDGSVSITLSGIQDNNFGPGLMNLCFLGEDGSFSEFQLHGWFTKYAMSQSGNLVVASCYDRRREVARDQRIHRILVFDGEGSLLYELNQPDSPHFEQGSPLISPDDRYIAIPFRGSRPMVLLDAASGEELHVWPDMLGATKHFSANSRYLSFCNTSSGMVVDCISGEVVWRGYDGVREIFSSNDGRLVCWMGEGSWTNLVDLEEGISIDSICQGRPTLSPNAFFLIAQRSVSGSLIPDDLSFFAARIEAGE